MLQQRFRFEHFFEIVTNLNLKNNVKDFNNILTS